MYRTHHCDELRPQDVGKRVELAGWVSVIRDHGGVLFLDLRDHYGTTQVVFHDERLLMHVNRETVIAVTGEVLMRGSDTVNAKLATGLVEVHAQTLRVLGKCVGMLPFEIEKSKLTREEIRLRHRFLDLRNPDVHKNIVLRSQVIRFIRKQMEALGFIEMQTPILTASSPEGARDFLVPSRKHPGKFYALPQAPQQFKQMLMVSGFDRYFQIAPCFRDEDARHDRSPGEFYQLDFEMAFAEQEDVLRVAEQVLYAVFMEFGGGRFVSKPPFQRITYADAMLTFGTDKPDLRNPLRIADLTDFFAQTDFPLFKGKPTRGIVACCEGRPRKFFEDSLRFAMRIGMAGLGYLTLNQGAFEGPIEKFLTTPQREALIARLGMRNGDTVFFISDDTHHVNRYAGLIRSWLGDHLGLVEQNAYRFCFVVDFPMYEADEESGQINFTHNPFSMPQGGLNALNTLDPLDISAHQYDVVLNGVELSSGAVRNHDSDTMARAFEIAGYDAQSLKSKFGALYTAFQYGAPPHAGMAPGIDRILMLLTGEESIRDVIAFPLNGNAQDMLFNAPAEVSQNQLNDIHYGSAVKRSVSNENAEDLVSKAFGDLQALNALTLTEDENAIITAFTRQVMDMESAMLRLNTDAYPPMIHVMPLENVFRDDTVCQAYTREELLAGAPARHDGYWQVPRLVQ